MNTNTIAPFRTFALAATLGLASVHAQAVAPRFKVVAIGELVVDGGPEIHAPFVQEAKIWLAKLAADSNFSVTHIENPNALTDAYLADFDLILQLNYTPGRWNATAQAAFEKYITEGRGGWVGMHHAGLYGPVITHAPEKLWAWWYTFQGEINYKKYIPGFAEGTVHVEDAAHPVLKGVPATFTVAKDEWYIWDKSPRSKVRVLANVDEASYKPAAAVKMGDHPVIWTNEKYKARNLYIFMGHHPDHFKNTAYTTLLRNAILWAAGTTSPTGIRKAGDAGAEPARAASLQVRADMQAIQYAHPEDPVRTLTVLDAAGHALYHAQGESLTGRIDRSGWSAGSFLIQAVTAKGSSSQWINLE